MLLVKVKNSVKIILSLNFAFRTLQLRASLNVNWTKSEEINSTSSSNNNNDNYFFLFVFPS